MHRLAMIAAREAVILLFIATFIGNAMAEDPNVARSVAHGASQPLKPFSYREKFTIECKSVNSSDSDQLWTAAPVCLANNRPLTLHYGADAFIQCTLPVFSMYDLERFASIIERKSSWNCRVPTSADRRVFIPVTIPLWGVVESDHLHVNIHLNFVFHAVRGLIVGAAIYPMQDRFLPAAIGTSIPLHGEVRWFEAHSYRALSSNEDDNLSESFNYFELVMLSSVVATLLASILFSLLYKFKLKPQLVKKYLKKD